MDDEPFSTPALLTGLAVSILVGGFLNLFSALGALTNNAVIAFVIGTIPGALFIAASRSATKNGFAQGLLIGGCIVALIGGACGASLVRTTFH
jgi:hypothetical protein